LLRRSSVLMALFLARKLTGNSLLFFSTTDLFERLPVIARGDRISVGTSLFDPPFHSFCTPSRKLLAPPRPLLSASNPLPRGLRLSIGQLLFEYGRCLRLSQVCAMKTSNFWPLRQGFFLVRLSSFNLNLGPPCFARFFRNLPYHTRSSEEGSIFFILFDCFLDFSYRPTPSLRTYQVPAPHQASGTASPRQCVQFFYLPPENPLKRGRCYFNPHRLVPSPPSGPRWCFLPPPPNRFFCPLGEKTAHSQFGRWPPTLFLKFLFVITSRSSV